MAASAEERRATEAEYLAMERASDVKHQLWEGEVFAMAGASLEHNLVVGNLVRVLGNALLDRSYATLPSAMKVRARRRHRYRRALPGRAARGGLTRTREGTMVRACPRS